MSFQSLFRAVERGLAITGLVATTAAGIGFYQLYNYQKETEKLYPPEIWTGRHPFIKHLPEAFILHLDLDQTSVVDAPSSNRWDSFLNQGRSSIPLKSIVQSIETATEDERVQGFVATGCNGVKGLGTIQELRAAISKFTEAGKKFSSIFFTDTFGEGENKTLIYYLASAFDKIYMPPCGRLSTPGFCLQVPFFKTLLTRFNVDVRVWAKEEFKTAFHMVTEDSLTPSHEEQLKLVLNGIFDQVAEGIAEGRGLSRSRIEEKIISAPLDADDSLTAGLIDRLLYRDEVWDSMKDGERVLPRISIKDYSRIIENDRKKKRRDQNPDVVVMHLSGPIFTGWSSPTLQRPSICSGKVVEQLAALVKNRDVKAVVLRIDSGGGSAIASNVIRREIKNVKDSGKFVVASMGNVAASGGYYIALGTNCIVANPGTLTGSIGVIVGVPFLKEAAEKFGINVELLKRGPNADMLSPFSTVTPEQEEVINRFLTDIYNDFKDRVHLERSLSHEDVSNLAKGRVFLGKEACHLHLIDEIGGLSEAIDIAKRGANLPPDANVVDYPASNRLYEFLLGLLNQFNIGNPKHLMQLRSSIEMYSFEADMIFDSIS